MQHPIDPKIDCVFKALLGAERNRNLLAHFLNAVLINDLSAPITTVAILNPYNDPESLDDKLSIVDVKAQDQQGQTYQIEIQLSSHRHLPARMLYTWADLYSQQLNSGEDYNALRPTYAIWLLAENLIKDDLIYARDYQLREPRGRALIPHGGIWLLELNKYAGELIETEQQRWLKFFKDGESLDDAQLPDWMNTDEMRQAMTTLRQFSEKERDYHAYQARQNYLREQRTIQKEYEAIQKEHEAIQKEHEAVQKEYEAIQKAGRLAGETGRFAGNRTAQGAVGQERVIKIQWAKIR
jgi:predicted transposase/invertase (TIGR01784 family)